MNSKPWSRKDSHHGATARIAAGSGAVANVHDTTPTIPATKERHPEDHTAADLADIVDIKDIRRSAMNLLARREHSRLEIARKLHRRYSEYELVETALDKLTADGLLSEDRFTEAYVNYRKRLGFGPVRIAAELRERGIGEPLANRYLNQSLESWIEAALAAQKKKFGEGTPATAEEKAKQQRFLSYRGFRHNHFSDFLN